MDGTGLLFEPFVKEFGERCAVTVVAYPTSGDSQTYAELQRFAESRLPPQGPVVLLAESFSGPLAIALASANPSRVVGVILCCTFLRNPRSRLRWLSSLLSVPSPLPPSAIFNAMLLGKFGTPVLRTTLGNVLHKVQPAVLRARLREVVSVDVCSQAQALEVPVLYLQARSDRLVPPSALVDAKRWCPNIKVQVFDAPHCLLQVVPAEAAESVAAFIEQVAAV